MKQHEVAFILHVVSRFQKKCSRHANPNNISPLIFIDADLYIRIYVANVTQECLIWFNSVALWVHSIRSFTYSVIAFFAIVVNTFPQFTLQLWIMMTFKVSFSNSFLLPFGPRMLRIPRASSHKSFRPQIKRLVSDAGKWQVATWYRWNVDRRSYSGVDGEKLQIIFTGRCR